MSPSGQEPRRDERDPKLQSPPKADASERDVAPPRDPEPAAADLSQATLAVGASPARATDRSPAKAETSVESAKLNDHSFGRDMLGTRHLLRSANGLLVSSFAGFMWRARLSRYEGLYQAAGKELAVLEARRAYASVPAYKEFIDQRVPDFRAIRRFSDLPETNKKDYIKPYADGDKLALYVDRTVPNGSSWDTSTGTSGKPTSWYRGPAEVDQAFTIMSHRARAILGKGSYAFINGFALGPWATGMTAARGVGQDSKSVTYNVGANPHMMLQLIEESRRIAPDRPVVVAGYPPHIEELVRMARDAKISLDSHQTIAVVGGEAMSELQRERMRVRGDGKHVKDTGFSDVFSFYGASDIDINLAFETPFEVGLRRELCRNPELMRALLGDKSPFTPMVFHYDPLNHLIEVNDKRQLVYTEVSGNRISPRVRYNLGDVGTTRKLSEVQALLQEHGVELPAAPLSNLPLVFVWGRIDDGITYRGANLAWENLEEGLRYLELSEDVKGFGLVQYEQDGRTRTDFALHVPNDARHAELSANGGELLDKLTKLLRKLNHDFDHQIQMVTDPADMPRLRLYRGDSPMAEHSRLNPARKQQHVFLGADAERALAIDGGGAFFEARR